MNYTIVSTKSKENKHTSLTHCRFSKCQNIVSNENNHARHEGAAMTVLITWFEKLYLFKSKDSTLCPAGFGHSDATFLSVTLIIFHQDSSQVAPAFFLVSNPEFSAK